MRYWLACHIPDRQSRGTNWIWPDLAFAFTHPQYLGTRLRHYSMYNYCINLLPTFLLLNLLQCEFVFSEAVKNNKLFINYMFYYYFTGNALSMWIVLPLPPAPPSSQTRQSLHSSQVARQTRAYNSFPEYKPTSKMIFLLPIPLYRFDSSPSQGYLTIKYSSTHLYVLLGRARHIPGMSCPRTQDSDLTRRPDPESSTVNSMPPSLPYRLKSIKIYRFSPA